MSKVSAISAAVADLTKKADKPPVAPPAALTYDPAAVNAQAVALAAADAAYENGLQGVAEGVARILGEKPTFEHWEAVAAAFQANYAKARPCAEKTAANRWHMLAGALRDKFALEKPAKGTKQAAQKAASREKAAKAVEKIVKTYKGNAQAILEAAAKASPTEVAVMAKAAEVAADAAAKEAVKKARGAEAKLREEGAKLMGAASGAVLERMVSSMRQIMAESKALEKKAA